MLTKKTLDHFKEWLHDQDYGEVNGSELLFIFNDQISLSFDNIPNQMKYGVYKDFFASKNIELQIYFGFNIFKRTCNNYKNIISITEYTLDNNGINAAIPCSYPLNQYTLAISTANTNYNKKYNK